MNNMVASHLTPPVREREPQESLYMDSPEVLGHALCTLVPDMMAGFCILTSTGEIRISAPDAPSFATAMEALLLEKIHHIQDEHCRDFANKRAVEIAEKLQENGEKWKQWQQKAKADS
ncbi:hypothetical protein QP556_11770 [Citrobacter freundii]|uniref:hypothetical protein n=1 Tax=Citrobacter freundii TaxID=546 RepID=UPI00254F7474|nr:hypothetical protein [Citrobacter freundii]MDK7601714.1 hypothetical protein [Citrobacter freundii]